MQLPAALLLVLHGCGDTVRCTDDDNCPNAAPRCDAGVCVAAGEGEGEGEDDGVVAMSNELILAGCERSAECYELPETSVDGCFSNITAFVDALAASPDPRCNDVVPFLAAAYACGVEAPCAEWQTPGFCAAEFVAIQRAGDRCPLYPQNERAIDFGELIEPCDDDDDCPAGLCAADALPAFAGECLPSGAQGVAVECADGGATRMLDGPALAVTGAAFVAVEIGCNPGLSALNLDVAWLDREGDVHGAAPLALRSPELGDVQWLEAIALVGDGFAGTATFRRCVAASTASFRLTLVDDAALESNTVCVDLDVR